MSSKEEALLEQGRQKELLVMRNQEFLGDPSRFLAMGVRDWAHAYWIGPNRLAVELRVVVRNLWVYTFQASQLVVQLKSLLSSVYIPAERRVEMDTGVTGLTRHIQAVTVDWSPTDEERRNFKLDEPNPNPVVFSARVRVSGHFGEVNYLVNADEELLQIICLVDVHSRAMSG